MMTDPKNVLAKLVRKHLAKTGNDRDRALQAALREVKNDESLLDTVLVECLTEAINYYITNAYGVQRDRAIRNATEHATKVVAGAQKKARVVIDELFAFTLQSGNSLGNAKRDEVLLNANHYLKTGKTNLHRGLWLKAIADNLPNNRTKVSRALSSDKIRALLIAAKTEVDAVTV